MVIERHEKGSTGLQAKTMNTQTFIREFGDEKLNIVRGHKAVQHAAAPSQQYQPVTEEHVSKRIDNDTSRGK